MSLCPAPGGSSAVRLPQAPAGMLCSARGAVLPRVPCAFDCSVLRELSLAVSTVVFQVRSECGWLSPRQAGLRRGDYSSQSQGGIQGKTSPLKVSHCGCRKRVREGKLRPLCSHERVRLVPEGPTETARRKEGGATLTLPLLVCRGLGWHVIHSLAG